MSSALNEPTPVQFAFLADRPDLIPQVAGWWCAEWGLPRRHASFAEYVEELASVVEPGGFPVHLLALGDEGPLGVATLKDWNMLQDRYPDYRYWLSGVYVAPAARRKGIATALCRKLLDLTSSRGIDRVYLQAEALDGGLYARIGFVPMEQICLNGIQVLVMSCDTAQRR